MDAWSSFPTHRDRLIQDDYGYWIDPRYGTPDIDEGAPAPPGDYVQGYLSAIGAYPYYPGDGGLPYTLPEEQGPLPPADPPVIPTPGEVTTYYVSPSGSNSNPGTEAQPFQTLQYAVDQMEDGDSLTIGDGTYTEGMGINTPGLTFLAESSSHVIYATTNYTIDLSYADRCVFRGIKTANAIRRGFSVSHSDNVTLVDCEAIASGTFGFFSTYSNYTTIDGGVWNGSIDQHGIYISNHSHYPTIRNIASGNCSGNARAGIQINADRQFADIEPDHVGPIIGAVIEDCVLTGNCTSLAGGQINLFGCHGAEITNVDCLNGLYGGINLSNDDNTSVEALVYGSKDCVMSGVTITGLRGISVKRGSTGLSMDDISVTVSSGPCIDYDQYSFPPMTLGNTYSLTTTAVGFKAFQNSSTGADYTVEEWRAL